MLDSFLDSIAVVAWILFALAVIWVVVRAYQKSGLRSGLRALCTPAIIILFLVALGVTLLSASLVFIEPQEVGVVISIVSRQGYREEPLRSGLHWIVPLAERVQRYPISWQTYTMSSDALEGDKVGNDSIAARTSDGQAVYIDSSVIFRLDSNEAVRVHIDLQDRYVEDFIRPVLRGIIRTQVSQFTADEVNSSKRKDLEETLQEDIRLAFSEKGFTLDRFLLRNIAFSDAYATAVEDKQVAEQAKIQREYQAEQIRTMAQAERDRAILEAQGQAEAIRLKAVAEAEALRMLADALGANKDLITLRYVDKLAPGIRVMLVPNDAPYLLPVDEIMAEPSATPAPTTLPSPSPAPTATPTATPTTAP